ncbi:MAG: hypothetical protein NUV69_00110 [Candidatus Curtissbacteria bacterium]|nr:hypothetical protein [Candidatus Curtissbacteria bacterium]
MGEKDKNSNGEITFQEALGKKVLGWLKDYQDGKVPIDVDPQQEMLIFSGVSFLIRAIETGDIRLEAFQTSPAEPVSTSVYMNKKKAIHVINIPPGLMVNPEDHVREQFIKDIPGLVDSISFQRRRLIDMGYEFLNSDHWRKLRQT